MVFVNLTLLLLYQIPLYRPFVIKFILSGCVMSLANIYQHTSVSSTKLPFDVWTVGNTIT
jgi:hypothetical protein